MSLINDPKRNWIIALLFLIIWIASSSIFDYVRFYYHEFFAVIGFTVMISSILDIVFSLINSIVMLKLMIAKKTKYHWLLLVMNLLPLIFIFLATIYTSLFN